jgi:CubicO group peptidase (beta-lactamase class C family)
LIALDEKEMAFMNLKQFIIPALLVGAALALSRRARHQPVDPKPDSTTQPASGDCTYAEIDVYLAEQMHRLHIPGAALAIIEGDRIVHQRGFGRARPGGEVPTPRTPFFIGSLTKSFTALAVMQLVEAGKVTLDAPVQRYLPWFRVADLQASAQMTVRHLLNQTSGLSMLPGMTNLGDLNNAPDATERQVHALSTLKIHRPVGTQFEYSNLNYNILGLIVAAASGESYPDYIQRHIFDPLEMHHSYTTKATARENNLAVGHRHWFSLPFPAPNLPIPAGSLPSGQLISCAEDISHYLIAHLNGGCYQDARILSSAGIDELHHGAAKLGVPGFSAGLYGMGWFEIDLGQIKTYSHGGNVPDFSAFMALVPDQNKAVVLLFNADPYGLPIVTEETGMGVTALLAGQQPAPIRLEFVQWIMRLLPLIPLLQVIGVFATLRRLRQWDRHPTLRPGDGRASAQQILLPLVPNLSLTAALFYLRSSGLMRYLYFYMPDVAWIARISGGFASIWALLHTGQILAARRARLPSDYL